MSRLRRRCGRTVGISSPGFKLHGAGFIVTPDEARCLEPDAPIKALSQWSRPDRSATWRQLIDLFGFTRRIEVRARYPKLYQWVADRVKPDRDAHRDKDLRERWWLHRRNNDEMRRSLCGLRRCIATGQTAEHRLFQFLYAAILPDDKLIAIALGVLSSRLHVVWALATGATLEDRPVYNKTSCFDAFPFPTPTAEQTTRIPDLAEQLDAHRKRQQAVHPALTLTGMYNVLEKLRRGEALNAKDKAIHEQGLVSVLKSLHDELDAAVLDAYGWSDLAPQLAAHADAAQKAVAEEAVLVRLVALNAERAAEEAKGHIRWLRPDYQQPTAQPRQADMVLDDGRQGAAPRRRCRRRSRQSPVCSPLRRCRSPRANSRRALPARARGRNACRRSSTRWKRWAACAGRARGWLASARCQERCDRSLSLSPRRERSAKRRSSDALATRLRRVSGVKFNIPTSGETCYAWPKRWVLEG
jgi:hypothetical protein